MDTFFFIVLPIFAAVLFGGGVLFYGMGFYAKQVNQRERAQLQRFRAAYQPMLEVISDLTVELDGAKYGWTMPEQLRRRINNVYDNAPREIK